MFRISRVANGLAAVIRRRHYSSSTAPASAAVTKESVDNVNKAKITESTPKGKLVAAAFESLKEDTIPLTMSQESSLPIDELIVNAKTVNGLLSISEVNNPLTRKHALKIVSILADWSSQNRVKLVDFENDGRFIKLCRILGRTVTKTATSPINTKSKSNVNIMHEDLNTVLSIAGDDEAAKLIANLNLSQMVKVMSSLAGRRKRCLPVLRSLSYNISINNSQLDLKQCADILYAMAILTFPDTVLTVRVCNDILTGLKMNKDKPAVVGSIMTSLGLLKYRDPILLDNICEWILEHNELCRPQDIASLFLTLATLNYQPSDITNLNDKLVKNLNKADLPKNCDWLNMVWSLVVLNLATHDHINSVLNNEFIEQLAAEQRGKLLPTTKLKLLNINAAAKTILKDYKGTVLPSDSIIYDVPLVYSKTKQTLCQSLLDAVKSLVASSNCLRTGVDSKMGFLIDAECLLDGNRNPLPLDKNVDGAKRVAIMIMDFHDTCQGVHQTPNGVMALNQRLLASIGYSVLIVPFNEFNGSDKLLKRVQYLENKLKKIVSK